jgi:hypothetical protein
MIFSHDCSLLHFYFIFRNSSMNPFLSFKLLQDRSLTIGPLQDDPLHHTFTISLNCPQCEVCTSIYIEVESTLGQNGKFATVAPNFEFIKWLKQAIRLNCMTSARSYASTWIQAKMEIEYNKTLANLENLPSLNQMITMLPNFFPVVLSQEIFEFWLPRLEYNNDEHSRANREYFSLLKANK